MSLSPIAARNTCTLPPPLAPGDLVYAVSLSGALLDRESIEPGLAWWRSRGIRVELLPGWDGQAGYLAGTDVARRDQLATALADRRCRGVVCTRGGYGAARLLEDWDWPAFGTGITAPPGAIEPKWLVGFSDVTALLWSLARQGVAGLHAPVLTTLATEPDWTRDRLWAAVTGQPLPPLTGLAWGGGQAIGRLLPGNLAVSTQLLGTPAQPLFTGAILAWEDVGEAPYRLDRLLTQWRSSGALAGVVGIALGRFSSCDPPVDRPSWTATEVLRDRLGNLGIPIVADLPFGHEGENAVLPVGVLAELDGDRGTLTLL